MAPAKNPVALITPGEIHTFIRRARAELRAAHQAEEGVPLENQALLEDLARRAEAASRLLDFCVEAAGWTRSPSMLPFLASMLRSGGEDDDDDDDAMEGFGRRGHIADSIGQILAAGAPITKDVAKLARSPHMNVRRVLAENLSIHDPAAVRILEALATTDDWDLVRKTARGRLAAVRDIAWWQGKFSRDPLAGVGPAEAEQLRAPLETIARLFELSAWNRRERTGELAGAIALLPDAPALDVLATLLSDPEELKAPEPLLLGALLGRDRDGSVLTRLVEGWARHANKLYRLFDQVHKMSAAVAVPERRAIARRLFDLARRRSDHDPSDPAAPLAANAMAALWPAEDDPTPVLDAVLAERERSGESHNDLQSAYWRLLSRKDLDVKPLLPRLAEARLSGYPPPWNGTDHWWDGLLDRAATGPELRDIAARIVAEQTDRYALVWALRQQMERAHDPSRDPPPAEILRRAWGQPLLRAAVITGNDLVRSILPIAREDLRAGRLAYAEAAAVLHAVGELWGGLVSWNYPARSTPEAEEKQREELRQKHVHLLGPEMLHGPPTDAEWSIFRALRTLTLAPSREHADWWNALRVLPAGEWTSTDRAVVLRAMELVRAKCVDLGYCLALTLSNHPDPAWIPLLDELADLDSDSDLVREFADRVRRVLRIPDTPADAQPSATPAPGNPAPAARPAPPVEWMDEPDDEP